MEGVDCIAVLKALSEISRLRILRLLLKDAHDVQEIAAKAGLSHYNASKHLRILREARLVETTREGKHRVYALAEELRDHLEANRNVLRLKCCTFRFDKLPK